MQTTTQMSKITQLDQGDLKQFIMQDASDAELMDYWGKHAASMRDLAASDEAPTKKGDSLIVILPGLMGSTLEDRGTIRELLWVNPLAYARGRINKLDLAEDGRSAAQAGVDIHPKSLMWIVYAKMVLQLSKDFEVVTFPFDWRLATWDVAPLLAQFIDRALQTSQFDRVTLVGHSLGGLLAADYLINPETRDHAEKHVRRAITLGAPFKGAVLPVGFLAQGGRDDIKLKIIEGLNPNNNVLQMLRSFPSMYQILPAPRGLYEGWDPCPDFDLWNTGLWSDEEVPINFKHLARAAAHHQMLAAADPQVDFYCVAGALKNTPIGIGSETRKLLAGIIKRAWDGDMSGDGTVAISSARFGSRPSYYVCEEHSELVLEKTVISGIMSWVEGREPEHLVKRIEEVLRFDLPMRGAEAMEGGFVSAPVIAEKAEQDVPLTHSELSMLASVM